LIYVVLAGRVVEKGTHDELIAKGGDYAHLYELQFRNNDNETAVEAAVS
jgi:ABC-type multidrug transport system fused ATPase/permease subunit